MSPGSGAIFSATTDFISASLTFSVTAGGGGFGEETDIMSSRSFFSFSSKASRKSSSTSMSSSARGGRVVYSMATKNIEQATVKPKRKPFHLLSSRFAFFDFFSSATLKRSFPRYENEFNYKNNVDIWKKV